MASTAPCEPRSGSSLVRPSSSQTRCPNILPVSFLQTVVETHPESLIDLRIHSPFPALVDYANSFNFEAMDSEQHGHIPAVVILVRALEEWRAAVSFGCPARES